MDEDASRTILLICDVWDNHWCADVRRRTESLAERINEFAKVVRKHGGRVLHCPSETVGTYYETWPQRQIMLTYPAANATIYDDMVEFTLPLETTYTGGCPDIPKCDFHCEYTKQHDGIEILPKDLISDSGQEIYNMLMRDGIDRVLMAGLALNMCIVSRPFGVKSLVNHRVPVSVVSDLVEVAYSPLEPPCISTEEAKWLALGYIQATLCPITNTYKETKDLPKERSMKIRTNLMGSLLYRLRRDYPLEYFVETGTAYGETTELAAIMFDRVWSCDIDPRLVEAARSRLVEYDNVEVTAETSYEMLARIKPDLDKPTLYWLDGHWCGGPRIPTKECPVLGELKAIGGFGPDGNSVILIDDINLMINPPPKPHNPKHWPTVEDIRNVLEKWHEPCCLEFYETKHHQTLSNILVVTKAILKETPITEDTE